jgi:glycosyltransferase involved in cell wall biosynthesis
MEKDLISVTIIAYNAEKTLQNTLNSISSQQHVQLEIVFVNDASTDSTLEIINDFKIEHPSIPCTIITNQTNLGITKSRNVALSHAQGNFIAVLDSDDVWSNPYKLKKQLDFLNQNPDHILVGTQIHVVDLNGMILKTTQYKTEDSEIKNKMLVLNQIAHSSILMRKINMTYDESFSIWEDYDFFLTLGKNA